MEVFNAKSFECCRVKLFQEPFFGGFRGIDPVVEFKHAAFVGEISCAEIAGAFHSQQFLGLETCEQFVNLLRRGLGTQEFSGRYVEKCDSHVFLVDMNCCKKVVFLSLQCTCGGVHTGCDELCYSAFHEFFRELRVFKLFAYRHSPSRPHEFWEIGIESMMRESGKLHRLGFAVGSPSESDAKNFACSDGVF